MSSGDGPILFGAVGAAGQLNPMLVLAGELARAGTPLHFASTDERRDEIERLGDGVRFVSMGEDNNPWYKNWDDETCHLVTGRHPRTIKPVVEFFRRDADPEAYEAMYRRAEEVVDRVRPGLMVLDLTMRYLVDVAMRRGIPFVLSCPATPSAELDSVVPKGYPAPLTGFPRHLTGWRRAANSAFRLRLIASLVRKTPLLALERKRAELAKEGGLEKLPKAWEAAVAVLSYTVFGLEYEFPLPEHVRLVGTMVPPLPQAPEAAGGELAEWLEAAESVVYVGLGTHMRLTRAQIAVLVSAFAELAPAHSVLWKLSPAQQELLPAELPPNLRVETWVPSQLDVLASDNVKVFVNHGGGNGVNEGLYFGKPLLVVPFWMDCFDFAARVADSGSGLVLDRTAEFGRDEVVAKLRRLLVDRRFTDRAGELSELLRAGGGARAAAGLVLAKHAEHAPREGARDGARDGDVLYGQS